MRSLLLASALLIAVSACGDDSPTGTDDPDAPVPTTLTLVASSRSLTAVGQTAQLTSEVRDENGAVIPDPPVEWSSEPPDVAAVIESGLVVALSPGTATVRATSGTVSASIAIDVSDAGGHQIVFVGRDRIGFEDLYRMDEDGSGVVRLTSTGDAQNATPHWSPDGTVIAFARRATDPIGLIDPDGGNLRSLPVPRGSTFPRWSPDSGSLAYNAETSTASGVFRIDREGGLATNLTGGQGGFNAVWSPDGTQLAFERLNTFVDQLDVWVMNGDGSGQTNLTAAIDVDVSPREWSPDGTRILSQVASDEIGVLDLSGPEPVLDTLASHPEQELWPSWSPDGSRVLFYSERDRAEGDLFIADVDGSNVVKLTIDGVESATQPYWFKPAG